MTDAWPAPERESFHLSLLRFTISSPDLSSWTRPGAFSTSFSRASIEALMALAIVSEVMGHHRPDITETYLR